MDMSLDARYRHETSHYSTFGNYKCTAQYCPRAGKPFKRLPDLIRHCKGAHCKRPEKFPCQVIGCKYSGDRGFTRKDKLKSHVKNIHDGEFVPGKAMRKIQPAALSSDVTGQEN